MEAESDKGGCLKVLAIAVPILALAAFLIWKAMQAGGRASEVAERVVNPYLDKVKNGQYQEALDAHCSDSLKQTRTAQALKDAYTGLEQANGRFTGYELYIAQEQHEIGGPSIVQARYTLKFERSEEHVVYDIAGEGDAARIDQTYDRPVGRETLVPAPR